MRLELAQEHCLVARTARVPNSSVSMQHSGLGWRPVKRIVGAIFSVALEAKTHLNGENEYPVVEWMFNFDGGGGSNPLVALDSFLEVLP